MDEKEIPREQLKLREKPDLLSPPYLDQPYQCATAVTVHGFLPHATIEVEVAGAVVISQPVEFPLPVGATIGLPAPLVAGQIVRARQQLGAGQSDWSAPVATLDHTSEYPAGPPRPVINPAPVFKCGGGAVAVVPPTETATAAPPNWRSRPHGTRTTTKTHATEG